MKLSLKILDILIIFLAAIIVLFTAYSTYIKPQGKPQILIQGQDSEWIFNIDAEEKITVTGPIGETVIRTGGTVVWVESSPCDNQNCVAQGFLRKPGQWTACLPNHVMVMIKSSKDEDVDAVSN